MTLINEVTAMKSLRVCALILALIALPILLSGCLPGIAQYTAESPAGFFNGIWHGWMAPLSLIMEIFGADVTMYARANSGIGYDVGFYMAVISGFGGLALIRRKRK